MDYHPKCDSKLSGMKMGHSERPSDRSIPPESCVLNALNDVEKSLEETYIELDALEIQLRPISLHSMKADSNEKLCSEGPAQCEVMRAIITLKRKVDGINSIIRERRNLLQV